jgi:hypothetical protein
MMARERTWRLTLSELMSAIAVGALAFGYLPQDHACILATVLLASITIDGYI